VEIIDTGRSKTPEVKIDPDKPHDPNRTYEKRRIQETKKQSHLYIDGSYSILDLDVDTSITSTRRIDEDQ
jgi:hypothetical protein